MKEKQIKIREQIKKRLSERKYIYINVKTREIIKKLKEYRDKYLLDYLLQWVFVDRESDEILELTLEEQRKIKTGFCDLFDEFKTEILKQVLFNKDYKGNDKQKEKEILALIL